MCQAGYGEFPWMAAILESTAVGPPRFLCGGSLIQNNVVLTAAHCIHNKVHRLPLLMGNVMTNVGWLLPKLMHCGGFSFFCFPILKFKSERKKHSSTTCARFKTPSQKIARAVNKKKAKRSLKI